MNYYTNEITQEDLNFLSDAFGTSLPEMQPLNLDTQNINAKYMRDKLPISLLIVESSVFNDATTMSKLCSTFDFSEHLLKIVIIEKTGDKDSRYYKVALSWIALELRKNGVDQLKGLADSNIYYLGNYNESPYFKHINPASVKSKISYGDLLKSHETRLGVLV